MVAADKTFDLQSTNLYSHAATLTFWAFVEDNTKFGDKTFTVAYFDSTVEKPKTPTPIEPQVNIRYSGQNYNFKVNWGIPALISKVKLP